MAELSSPSHSFTLAAALALLMATSGRAAAHGGTTDTHGHLLPIAVFLGAVTVLAASLAADHWDLVDRSTADFGVVGGGLGIVLSVGLLWL